MVSLLTLLPEEVEKAQLEDMNRKLSIAHSVVQVCKAETNRSPPVCSVSERALDLTKAHINLILRSQGLIRPNITYTEPKQTHDILLFKPQIYEILRNVYVDSYLRKNHIPTKTTFESNFKKNKKQPIVDCLKRQGFTWIKIPGTSKCLLVESPSQVRRKCEYFMKIAQYRSEGRHIVYIEEMNCRKKAIFSEDFSSMDDNLKFLYLIAANKEGTIHLSFFSTGTVQEFLRKFFMDLILTKIKTPTVFVLGEKFLHEKNKCPLPKLDSPKAAMLEFLTRNNIPHDANAPKAELYLLIQQYKNTCKTEFYSLDDLVSGYGHVILRRPYVLSSLSYFTDFVKRVKEVLRNGLHHLYVVNVISTMSVADWQRNEQDLIERENEMYTEDVKIEEIVDKLFMMAEDGRLSQDDFVLNSLDKCEDTGCSSIDKIVI
ncbi:uncharacterized protein LOC126377886 [Pectinophora gossypiella]|uniref:uncharacterized protein LOC126377886 n=1 Tax=Pectinophora gossypiella TaxID=13191 RepID=UPI00214E6F6D|nr:uncharacterized protein LOC126377886 [Pectinophora gossypiella]